MDTCGGYVWEQISKLDNEQHRQHGKTFGKQRTRAADIGIDVTRRGMWVGLAPRTLVRQQIF